MNSDFPTSRADYVYRAILLFAGGKRYLMRSPIKLWWELKWNEEHINGVPVTQSQKDKCRVKFTATMKDLEDKGYIRRFSGGIEVLENVDAGIPGRENRRNNRYARYPVVLRNSR